MSSSAGPSGSGRSSAPGVDQAASALIQSILPHSADSPGTSAAARRQAQRAQTQAEEVVFDVLGSQLAARQASDVGFAEERLRRAIQRRTRNPSGADGASFTQARADSSSEALRVSNLISRLQSMHVPPKQLSAYLTLLEQLAYTEGTHVPAIARATSAAPSTFAELPQPKSRPLPASQPASRADLPQPAVPNFSNQPAFHGSGKSKASLLKEWKRGQGQPQVPESALLRDLIFLLQGISGKFLHFEEVSVQQVQEEQHRAQVAANLAAAAAARDSTAAPPPVDVGKATWELGDDIEGNNVLRIRFKEGDGMHIAPPTRHLIHRIAELGRLYRRISAYANRTLAAADPTHASIAGAWGLPKPASSSQSVGLIKQSLCHFIQNELTEYYRLIAVLEAQLQIESDDSAEERAGLTLKRISAWTDEFLLRMRMISAVIESCKESHGGALVSVIHTYTFNGDPFIRKFTARLLEEVSKPFLHTLSRWIHEGELHDPFQEFFVQLNADQMGHGGTAYDGSGKEAQPDVDAALLWQNKFSFREEMLPSFLGESFGRKIFSTGKSLNFIRHSCGGGDWIATRNQLGGNETQGLRYTDIAGLEATINSAYSIVSQRLLGIFLEKFNLMGHLTALKDYLMLTKGDFVDLLMESIGPSLNRQASSLFRHNLTACLETAVRGSNAQYDNPDVLRRLDARILEFSAGDTGWDTFTLDYKVDSPVNTVLDVRAMSGYQAVFNHLWKIKRVELALSSCWSRLCAAKAGHGKAFGRKKEGAQLEAERGMMRALHRLGEMTHFIRQLQAFNQLEVIEYSWYDLQQFFSKRQGDLDELIEAHRAFLDALVGKMMLKGGRRSSATPLVDEVRANLDTMLAFCSAIDDLAHYINGEAAKAGFSEARTRGTERVTFPAIMSRVDQHSTAFQDRTQSIIAALEKHANLVVRDLGSRLNFNSFYERKDKDRTLAGGKDKE
ncbi:Microtubule-nucleating Tub4p (gamma-tubulin) complex component [Tilletia horrida]|nr:Microtubule-nucleating Tub4p (gamma-tubulin) complex component [Tilletia horrida]